LAKEDEEKPKDDRATDYVYFEIPATFKFNPEERMVFSYRRGYMGGPDRGSVQYTPIEEDGSVVKDWLMKQKRSNPGNYFNTLEQLWAAGYIPRIKEPDQLLKVAPRDAQKAWESFLGYVQNESRLTPAGQQKPDVQSLLFQEAMSYRGVPTPKTGAGAGGPFRSETTSVTEYDETNVMDIANNAYSQILGRRATKKERQALAQILNQEQSKAPKVTISEGTTSGGMMTGQDGQRSARGTVSTTTTKGGIVPAELAEQKAIQAEDFEERFFVSTFSDMLQELSRPF
jgi:hypothetical protein